MSALTDLATVALWPLAAIALVLCGMTLASSGRSAPPTAERRAAASAPGGRRATDGLPGDRTMVVVTGETSADTVRRAIEGARGGASSARPVDVVADPVRPHPRWEAVG
ncbi:MAG: hypothetical protein ACK5CE_24655 [Actinomycetes bacterium]|uniref:Unannotated protein n=1 Tax=freshwater metagenome TaxID=449393 RepID=A0A6J6BIS5_9ZZZZ|nr:hypothetical protein [Actinomycetota bacterium]